MNAVHTMLCAIVLFFGIVKIQAQSTTGCQLVYEGLVVDHHDNQTLAYATLYFQELETVATTDSLGRFSMENLCPGSYTVVVRHLGCEDVIRHVDLRENTHDRIELEHHQEWLNEVSVVGHRKEDEPVKIQSQLRLKSWESTLGEGLQGALNQLPGVTVQQSGNNVSKPMINGLEGARVLIVQDGLRLEGQSWGSDHGPELDPIQYPTIQVVKGAQALRYGAEAIGGVLLLNQTPINLEKSIAGSMRSIYASNGQKGLVSGNIQAPVSKDLGLYVRVAGSIERGGNIHEAGGRILANTGQDIRNWSWELSLKNKHRILYSHYAGKLAIFSGAHIGNLTDFQNALNGEAYPESDFTYAIKGPYQDLVHERIFYQGESTLKGKGVLNYQMARQYNGRKEIDHETDDRPELELGLTNYLASTVFTAYPKNGWSWSAGLSGRQSDNTSAGGKFIPGYELHNAAAFGEIGKSVGHDAKLEAGMRLEMLNQDFFLDGGTTSKSYSEGAFQFGLELGSEQHLVSRTQLSTGWRPPSVNELFANGVHHGAATFEQGNPDLDPERAVNVNQEVSFHHGGLEIQASAFGYRFSNFITSIPNPEPVLTIRGVFPKWEYAQVSTHIGGANIVAQIPVVRKVHLNVNGSWMRAFSNSEIAAFGLPADQVSSELEYFSKEDKPLRFSSRIACRKVFKKVQSSELDLAPLPDGYFLWYADADVVRATDKHTWKIGVKVNNLFDVRFREVNNRFRYYSWASGRSINARVILLF